jgi:hypothetical protein
MSIKKSLTAKGVYKVTFSFPAVSDGKKNVKLLGDFNNWDSAKAHVMKSGKNEYSSTIELKPGTYEFRYLIDNMIWENDLNADNYVASPFAGINNSVLHLPAVPVKTAPAKTAKPAAPKATAKSPVKPAVKKAAPAKPAAVKEVKTAASKAATKPAAPKAAAPKAAVKSATPKTTAPKAASKPAAPKAVKKDKK